MSGARGGFRKFSDWVLGLVFRLFIFLLFMKLVYPDWTRFLFSPQANKVREQEIVRSLDGFTGGPKSPVPTGLPASILLNEPGTPPPIRFPWTMGSDPGSAAPASTHATVRPRDGRNGRTTIDP